jgi:FMN phosphatase YigB (HAD superfamily)
MVRTVLFTALFSLAAFPADWQTLFDGRSLAGWRDPGRRIPPSDSWTIEDGAIKSLKNPKIREDLMTTAEFTDFELEFEWRVSPGANSGVKYAIQETIPLDRGKLDPKMPFELQVADELKYRRADRANLKGQGEEYVVGFEYQVIDDTAHADARRGALYQAGALYSMWPAAKPRARAVGEWNQSKIVKRGSRVEHWLNGEKVVDTALDAPEILAGVARRWSVAPHVNELLSKRPKKSSPIGLQNHNDIAWFRSIRIRTLP